MCTDFPRFTKKYKSSQVMPPLHCYRRTLALTANVMEAERESLDNVGEDLSLEDRNRNKHDPLKKSVPLKQMFPSHYIISDLWPLT